MYLQPRWVNNRFFRQVLTLLLLMITSLVIVDIELGEIATSPNHIVYSTDNNSIIINNLERQSFQHQRSFLNDDVVTQIGIASNEQGRYFPNSFEGSNQSQVAGGIKDALTDNLRLLPKTVFSQEVDRTYVLLDHEVTPYRNSSFSMMPEAKLQNITIHEDIPPELRLNISHLMKSQWLYSEDFSEGVVSDSFSLYFINTSDYLSKALSATYTVSSSSNSSTPFFFSSRSLHYNIGSLEAKFSHVTKYPTLLLLNLSLHEFSFTSPTQEDIPSDSLFRIGLKFNSASTLNSSTSGGIFYIVWRWSDYFAPISTSMLDVYNATIGSAENGPVYYFPKNLSTLNNRMLLTLNLTKLLQDLAWYNSSDNFEWQKVQLYFDSLSEIFFEWHVLAQDVPMNSTLRIQFTLDDIKLSSQVPEGSYSWRASLNNFEMSFSKYSSNLYVFSIQVSLNSSTVNVIFDVEMSDDSNLRYLFWNITIQYTIVLKHSIIWEIRPIVTSNYTTTGIISQFALEGNITHDFFNGNVTMFQEILSLTVPFGVELMNYTLSSTSPTFSNSTEVPQLYIAVKGLNQTHELLSFVITTNDTPMDVFSSYFLQLNALTSNKIASVSLSSSNVVKGDDWVSEGSITGYPELGVRKEILDVIIYQNISHDSFTDSSHLTIHITSSGYFIVYLSSNLTSSLVEGDALIILHWNARWFQGLLVIPVVIVSVSTSLLPASISNLSGTSVYQFESWIIYGELNVPQKYVNSSAVVDLFLVENLQRSLDVLLNQSVTIVINKSLLVKNLSSWSLYLGSASLMAGNYSLITKWQTNVGITFYNVSFVSVFPSTVYFIPDRLVQPSRNWLSLEVTFKYASKNDDYKSLISNELAVLMTLNDSYSVKIENLDNPNGTINVFWSNLPDYWSSFYLKWYLIGIQGVITNGSLIIFNQFEVDSYLNGDTAPHSTNSNGPSGSLLVDAMVIVTTITLPTSIFYFRKKKRSANDII